MKELINKIIQVSTAILISCVVVYGIVYAQLVCCTNMVNTCIPASNRILDGYTSDKSWTNFQSYDRNNQLRSNLCSKNVLADFGPGNTCCETDRCDSFNQATYFSLSFIQDFFPLLKDASSFDTSNGTQTTFEPFSLSTSLKAEPIYIMTQSIIC